MKNIKQKSNRLHGRYCPHSAAPTPPPSQHTHTPVVLNDDSRACHNVTVRHLRERVEIGIVESVLKIALGDLNRTIILIISKIMSTMKFQQPTPG